MDDTYRTLTSLAVARELYDREKSLYDVLKEYIKVIIIEEKLYSFDLPELTGLLNRRFSFSVKDPVVKTCLRQMNLVHKGSFWQCDIGQFNIDEWRKSTLEAERKSKYIIHQLMNYIGRVNGSEELDFDENYYAKTFCDYLINSGAISNDELKKIYSEFIVSMEDNEEFVDAISQLKEGTIFFEGIRYCDNPSEIGARWKGNMILYLDTEILFALSGYNNSLLQDYSLELLKSIKEINRNCPREKRIRIKFFESTKKEIDYYFDSAIRIVKGLDVLDPTKEAMSQIVKGCLRKSDVEQKRSLLFQNLREKGIEIDWENYYDEKYADYNIEQQELEDKYTRLFEQPQNLIHESIKHLSNINKLRKGINDRGLENCIAIFVTGTSRTIKLSKVEEFINDHEVPKATTVDFLINYLWLKSNKGFGIGVTPRTLDMIAQSRFILKNMMIDQLSEQYSQAKDMYENAELSKEAFAQLNFDIREKIQYVEDGDIGINEALEDVSKWDFRSADELVNYQKNKEKQKDEKLASFSKTIESQEHQLNVVTEDNNKKDSIIERQEEQLQQANSIIQDYQKKDRRHRIYKRRAVMAIIVLMIIGASGLLVWGIVTDKLFIKVFSGLMDFIGLITLLSPLNKKIYPIAENIQSVDKLSCEDDISA